MSKAEISEVLPDAEAREIAGGVTEEALVSSETVPAPPGKKPPKAGSFAAKWKKYGSLVPFVIPAILFGLVFAYLPMVGLLIAFKDNIDFYHGNPLTAFFNAEWNFDHFIKIFSDPEILTYIGNTLFISVLKIVILFPLPVVLAIMITEVGNKTFSKLTQLAVFLPHFLSWVVITGVFKSLLAVDGPVNAIFGIEFKWFGDNSIAPWLIVALSGWKEIGYSSIVYVAAIMAIDPNLYEAAKLDGAGKFRQIWSITIPSILPTIITMLIIRVGYLMDAGFDQIYAMFTVNPPPSSEIIGTYVYRISLGQSHGQYGLSTAVGLFNGLVALILILVTNKVAKKATGTGIL